VRRAAAHALGQLGQVDKAGRLLLTLAGDEKVDAGVRHDAVQALVQLGQTDESVLKVLLTLVEDEKVDVIDRYFSYEALNKLLGG
jgi:HEAT repeat protein